MSFMPLNPPQPRLEHRHLGSTGQRMVMSAVLVGAVIGAGAAMLIGDRVGRRVLIAASAVVSIAGTAIATGATSIAVLIGKPATFWLCAGLCVAAIVFTWFFVPETKGKTLEEIETYWRSRAERDLEPMRVPRPAEAPAAEHEASR